MAGDMEQPKRPYRVKDITGQRFGKLTAVSLVGMKTHQAMWECQCDCGNTTIVSVSHLLSGHTKSCGCMRTGHDPKRLKDLTGQRFGRLVAIRHVGYDKRGQAIWEFKCDCGNTIHALGYPITYGNVTSCGCYNREKTVRQNYKHGFSVRGKREKLYVVWCALKKRCKTPTDKAYKYYGARGIDICDEWETYEPFREWAMANGYKDGLTIDRIDNDGNYCPENCRWVDMVVQSRNTRRTIKIVMEDGTKKPFRELCEELGINANRIRNKIYRDMPQKEFEEIIRSIA